MKVADRANGGSLLSWRRRRRGQPSRTRKRGYRRSRPKWQLWVPVKRTRKKSREDSRKEGKSPKRHQGDQDLRDHQDHRGLPGNHIAAVFVSGGDAQMRRMINSRNRLKKERRGRFERVMKTRWQLPPPDSLSKNSWNLLRRNSTPELHRHCPTCHQVRGV
jgi:hypothetical protein